MKKNQIHWFEDSSLNLNLETKTGRHQLKIHAGYACFAKQWYESRTDSEKPFFVSGSRALHKRMKRLAKKLGIKKPLRWYDWRRVHAIWAFENMPPVVAKTRLWNNPSSKQDAIYFKVSNKSVNEYYDRATGGKVKKKKSPFKKIVCWKCSAKLKPGTGICPTCNIEPDAAKYFDSTSSLFDMLEKRLDEALEKKLDERLNVGVPTFKKKKRGKSI